MCGRSLPHLALVACLLLLSECKSGPAAELTVPRRIVPPGPGEGAGHRARRGMLPAVGGAASWGQQPLYLLLPAFGTELLLDLNLEQSFLAPTLTVEERGDGQPRVRQLPAHSHCFYTGHVLNQSRSSASLSTCNGLFGYIQIGDDLLSIEPVNKLNSSFSGEVHQIYRHERSLTSKSKHLKNDFCKVIEGRKRLKKADGWRPRRNAIRLTNEYTVETLVVADSDMVEYHGAEAAQRFILTVMNMVYNMFQHHSLGIKINIQVTKLILLRNRPDELLIGHHGERSLESFCRWQHKEFGTKYLGNNHVPGGKDDFPAVDAAVFVTRTDFCVHKDEPCDTVDRCPLHGIPGLTTCLRC